MSKWPLFKVKKAQWKYFSPLIFSWYASLSSNLFFPKARWRWHRPWGCGSKRKDLLFYDCLSLAAQTVKNPPAMWEAWVWSLGWEDPLEESMVTHSSTHGQRSLEGYSPWGCRVRHYWATMPRAQWLDYKGTSNYFWVSIFFTLHLQSGINPPNYLSFYLVDFHNS